MKQFAVIGLGRFGSSVAKTLGEKGHDVIAIDKNEEFVHDIMDFVAKAVCLDATDEKAMSSVGIQNVDVAVCGTGTNVEASILITLLLKEFGIPTIVCKAVSEPHKKVLLKIGATKVILPERDMGVRVANTISAEEVNVLEHIDLPGNASIIEIVPPEEFVGKSLREIDTRAKYGVNVIAIKQQEKEKGKGISPKMNIAPQADDIVNASDVLVVIGENEKIEELKARG